MDRLDLSNLKFKIMFIIKMISKAVRSHRFLLCKYLVDDHIIIKLFKKPRLDLINFLKILFLFRINVIKTIFVGFEGSDN